MADSTWTCPLCSGPEPMLVACISSACEHGCWPKDACPRCHPERCPCRDPRMKTLVEALKLEADRAP